MKKCILFTLFGWFAALVPTFIFFSRYSDCPFFNTWPFCSSDFFLFNTAKIIFILVVISAISLGYFCLFRLIKKGILPSKKIIFWCLFIVYTCAVGFLPFTSSDIVFYYDAGKNVEQGLNVYKELWYNERLFVKEYERISIQGIMYGPLAVSLFAFIYQISSGSFVVFTFLWKLVMLASLLGAAFMIYHITRIVRPAFAYASFLLVATNPLLLWEWVGAGHFDGLWIFLVLLSFFATLKGRLWMAIVCFVLSVWIKFIPVIFVPWYVLWYWRKSDNDIKLFLFTALKAVCITLLLTCVVWWPYGLKLSYFDTLLLQSKWAVQSLFAALYYTAKPLFELLFGSHAHWILTRIVHGFMLSFSVYLLWPIFIKGARAMLAKCSLLPTFILHALYVSLFVFLLVWQKSLWPWYIAWLIPFALLSLQSEDNVYYRRIFIFLSVSALYFYPLAHVLKNNSELRLFWGSVLIMTVYPLVQYVIIRRKKMV